MAESSAAPHGFPHARFLQAQAAFLAAAEETLDAGERYFEEPESLVAAVAYQRARQREREAAEALAEARRGTWH